MFALAGAGAAAQLAFGRTAPWAGAAGGSLALATGMIAIVLAAGTETPALFWIGSLIGGAGFGVAFLGGLRALSAAIPPQHRAEVMSAFYIVAYAAISLPAILAGVLVDAARPADDLRALRLGRGPARARRGGGGVADPPRPRAPGGRSGLVGKNLSTRRKQRKDNLYPYKAPKALKGTCRP